MAGSHGGEIGHFGCYGLSGNGIDTHLVVVSAVLLLLGAVSTRFMVVLSQWGYYDFELGVSALTMGLQRYGMTMKIICNC